MSKQPTGVRVIVLDYLGGGESNDFPLLNDHG